MLPINLEFPEHFFNDEIRCDYLVTKHYKELWAVELDLLSKFIEICGKLKISYLACAGTMLGAARHKGIIPWDDDIDVMMMRDDYEKLCENSSCFRSPYFFQTEFTDRGSLRGHAQLRNSMTTGILGVELESRYSFNQGIFIDIFPLDNLPDDDNERVKFINNLRLIHSQMIRIRNISACQGENDTFFKHILRQGVRIADKWFSLSHVMFKKYEKLMTKYNSKATKEKGILALSESGNRFIWSVKDLEGEPIFFPFEILTIPLPNSYKNILEKTYGNWQQLRRGGSVHGELIFDAHESYKEYFKRNL